MLMLTGKIHDLSHLGLGNFVGEDAALSDAVVMNMQHDASGRFAILLEEPFENVDDELHRRVVVVEKQDPVEARLLGLGFGARDDCGAAPRAVSAMVAVLHFCPAILIGYTDCLQIFLCICCSIMLAQCRQYSCDFYPFYT